MKSDVYINHLEDSLRGYRVIRDAPARVDALYALSKLLTSTLDAVNRDITASNTQKPL